MARELAKHLGGGVSWLASTQLPFLPRISFAPDGDGTGANDEDTTEGDDDAAAGGDDKSKTPDPKDDKTPAPKNDKLNRGLLATRKPADGKQEPPDPKLAAPGPDGRPANVPEKFWDPKTKTVKADAVVSAYTALEKAHGDLKRAKGIGADVPEKPEEYFPAEGLKLENADRYGDTVPADDPGLQTWAKVAKKWGIGKEAAMGIAKEMFSGMNEFAPEPVNMEAEREALGPSADDLIDGVYLWIEAEEASGKLSEADVEVAVGLSSTADGIRFLQKMRQASGAPPIPMGQAHGARGMSQEDWHSAMREAVKAQDYKEQERLDAMSGAIFGTDPSSGSSIQGIPNQKDVERGKKK